MIAETSATKSLLIYDLCTEIRILISRMCRFQDPIKGFFEKSRGSKPQFRCDFRFVVSALHFKSCWFFHYSYDADVWYNWQNSAALLKWLFTLIYYVIKSNIVYFTVMWLAWRGEKKLPSFRNVEGISTHNALRQPRWT